MTRSGHRGGNRAHPRVMRVGKTRRDHDSGAWAHHRHNQHARRLENSARGHALTTSFDR